MSKKVIFTFIVAIFWCGATTVSFCQTVSEPFEFQFEGKTLSGLIEKPKAQKAKAVVIIIPGYGRTDFVEGNWFSGLRNKLVALGLTVCTCDKIVCGKSEGEFNAQQAVDNSANEAMAAIKELKKRNISGSEKIGLWGISRAGWICPLINAQFPIDFWISVSGTDDKENFGYLLKSNLVIAGKKEEEAERLFEAWSLGHQYFSSQADYEQYLAAIQPLKKDSICRNLFGYTNEIGIIEEDRKAYESMQKEYTRQGYFDIKSGLWVYLENFDETLMNIDCPVLALFGANDSQVDWRKTKHLYEETIGVNPNSELVVEVFDNCNHSLQKCITCGYQEDLSALNWQACDGYYDTMEKWLRNQKIIE